MEAHGTSPWKCIRLSLLLDKPCNICFLPWVGKMINIDLFGRKSFGCLTRVVHKSSPVYCESYKTMNSRNIKECYFVAKKKLIRGEKTKPQTAMVITLWF